MATWSGPDKRAFERVHAGIPMVVHFEENDTCWAELEATVVDVSQAGLLVRCERLPRTTDTVMVSLIYGDYNLCAAAGHPVRLADDCFGITLTRTDERWRALLDELVNLGPDERRERLSGGAVGRLWIDCAAA